jgi:1,4-dihydroxy-2-naphthoate octaprenyltransferase
MASAYVHVEHLSWEAFYASLPVGLLVANILHANNLRDIENDRARSKLTIAGLVDRPVADYILIGLTLGSFVCVAAAVAFGALPAFALLVVLSVPAAISTFMALRVRPRAGNGPPPHAVRGIVGAGVGARLVVASGRWALEPPG